MLDYLWGTVQPARANVCKAVQERKQELNEEGKPEFLAKMNTLGNTSNTKEEVKKNSNAQKDKRDQPTKTNHVEGTQNETVYKSGRVNDDSYEIEAVLSPRKEYRKWMYEVKWLGHVETTWVTYKNLLGAARE